MNRRFVHICVSLLLCCFGAQAKDTVYVSGGIQHDGLLDWTPVMYHSNSYVDLSLHYAKGDKWVPSDVGTFAFRELRVSTRAELTQWPLPGYETDFHGYGISRLSMTAVFDGYELTVGDVYGQFGAGLVLNLYEDRALGVDGALRGAKIVAAPYKGLQLTLLGGKQRRYWSCYDDQAWGWNYRRDAVLGGDMEVHLEEYSPRMRAHDMRLMIGGSYVSKYEAADTILTLLEAVPYMYRLPRWVGAGAVRAAWAMKGVEITAEYARKANDPTLENGFSYREGDALMLSAAYSRKGLAVLAQVKRSDNMSFRSERMRNGIAGRLNHMPAFAPQHTYTLAGLYPYATQYAGGEWAFQTELRYTWARKTRMGGRYGTTLKLSAAHIRGLKHEGSWAVDTRSQGEYYTDVNVELHKRLTPRWWLNAMVMYQTYNRQVVEGHGGLVRSGIAVVDTRVQASKDVSVRGECQYLYTPHYQGQWMTLLCELSLFRHWTVSGQWLYNIGGAAEATHAHYYTGLLTYTHGAHRVAAGYTKTREGYNCSGGVCRYVPEQEGVVLSYNFTW